VQAALTALAFVLASLVGVLHESTTIHVRCAQHGELVDRRAGADAWAEAHDAAPRFDALPALPASPTEGHVHCALASAMRESRLAPQPPALVLAPVAVAERAIPAPDLVAARDRGLYRTAPKTSPPA
jgi:hypothetical protein